MITYVQTIDDQVWVMDDDDNRASVARWGSEEEAKAALRSNSRCKGCTDCRDCANCTDCFLCFSCIGLTESSWCRDCSNGSSCTQCESCKLCKNCSDCSNCLNCSDCTGCHDCLDTDNCRICFYCNDVSRCNYCWYCSFCEHCSSCNSCVHCSNCDGCRNCIRKYHQERLEEQITAPRVPDLHRKVYEAASRPGGLDMGHWHRSCDTTHCRAGWVIHLAGEAGYALEHATSPVFAAMMIYKASGYDINPCRFFDLDAEALEDMKRLAESEATHA